MFVSKFPQSTINAEDLILKRARLGLHEFLLQTTDVATVTFP